MEYIVLPNIDELETYLTSISENFYTHRQDDETDNPFLGLHITGGDHDLFIMKIEEKDGLYIFPTEEQLVKEVIAAVVEFVL